MVQFTHIPHEFGSNVHLTALTRKDVYVFITSNPRINTINMV